METYFKIRYEFDKDEVFRQINNTLEQNETGYICVADGNVLTLAQHEESYHKVLYHSLFAVCDSGWVPLYLRGLFGIRRSQYCGYQIFNDIVDSGKYRMLFLGGNKQTLDALRNTLISRDPRIADMKFLELPFSPVEEFDYAGIAKIINADAPDIIWVALGAPKQEQFMYYLQPHLSRGIQIAVGAVFHFFSGLEIRRAPQWMVKCKLEFLHRLMVEPKKQFARCRGILTTLPRIFRDEKKRRKSVQPGHFLKTIPSDAAQTDCVVATCFGKAPDDIDSLLNSWRNRTNTVFLLFTDDARFWTIPANVKIIPITFCELQALIHKKLNRQYSISHYYELSELQGEFEKIFADYLLPYEYIGAHVLGKTAINPDTNYPITT